MTETPTPDWASDSGDVRLYCADCLDILPQLPDNSIDLIATDPPYYKVKGEDWDRQWDTPALFIEWIGELCEQWHRVLKPNGSLYVFASPKMSARVECEVARWFEVLNHIVWRKGHKGEHTASSAHRTNKDILRSFNPETERIIFAEHFGADNIAKGEAGYAAKCDELRGFVFEPLRAYLDGERKRAGVSTRQVAGEFQKRTGSRTVTGMAGHWFTSIQWALPTAENYNWFRQTLASLNSNGQYLRREYEDLRREYEDLRREYEDLRRPFSVSANVPYTDVWDFPTVGAYPGKHPCEKPLEMMAHIITASSKPGATVLDCFAGSGVTLQACAKLGRIGIGIEKNAEYFAQACEKIQPAQCEMAL